MSDKPRPLWPLTGTFFVEFVDGADPDDPSAAPNFGIVNTRTEPESWSYDPRLVDLLRFLVDCMEADQREEST